MLTQALAFCMCLAATGQNSINGNQLRVTSDRAGIYVDTVWWYGTGTSPIVGWQRNGVNQATHTIAGGIYPDVDTDDWGNTYIAYQAPDPNNNNIPSIFLSVDFNPPVLISGTAGGVNPTVTVCRGKGSQFTGTNGQVAIAWNSGTTGGIGRYPGVMAATYSFVNGVFRGQMGITTPPFPVNANISGSTYSPPDISSDANGNYVITYSRSEGSSSNGVCAVRFNAGTSFTTAPFGFPETLVAVPFATNSGSFHYTQPHVSCWSNGESVVLFNVPGADNLVATHIGTNGVSGTSVQFGFNIVNPPSPFLAYQAGLNYYPNNGGVAALRFTPGSYIVTWPATVGPNGGGLTGFGSNVVYQKVVGDTISPVGSNPTFVTTVNHQLNNQSDTSYGNQSIALSDPSPADIFIVWSLSPFANGPPVNNSISPPIPTF